MIEKRRRSFSLVGTAVLLLYVWVAEGGAECGLGLGLGFVLTETAAKAQRQDADDPTEDSNC